MNFKKFNYKKEADRLLSYQAVNHVSIFHKFLGMKKVVQLFRPFYVKMMSEIALMQIISENVTRTGLNIFFVRIKELFLCIKLIHIIFAK